MEKYKVKIEDDRLTSDMKRTRSGSTQMFRRDYGDYRFTDIDNADVVLEPPSKEMYAEIIEGVWYWVKGCSKCPDSMNYGENYSYQVCHEHDRCVECNTHRSELSETPWGHRDGIICKPCMDRANKLKRDEAFAKINNEDYDEWDYKFTDSVLCPHCGSDLGIDDMEDGEMRCDVCDGHFKLSLDYSISYSTEVIGERLTC